MKDGEKDIQSTRYKSLNDRQFLTEDVTKDKDRRRTEKTKSFADYQTEIFTPFLP